MYKTPPLTESLTLAGPMSAVLHAATSAKDTDWAMRLVKEDREGRALPLGQGVIRARYRESHSAPTLLEPGAVYEYHLDLSHTGVTVGEGERLTLVISSALFPKLSRNLNTGGHSETEHVVAEQTVYHDRERPSYILLPVIPEPVFGAE